jgi:hypothetical protein
VERRSPKTSATVSGTRRAVERRVLAMVGMVFLLPAGDSCGATATPAT